MGIHLSPSVCFKVSSISIVQMLINCVACIFSSARRQKSLIKDKDNDAFIGPKEFVGYCFKHNYR